MDLHWGKDVASTDAWIGRLQGVLVGLDPYQVTYLVVKRGLIFSQQFVVPFDDLEHWDDDGLYLKLSISQLFKLPTSQRMKGEPPRIMLSSCTDVRLAEGTSLRLKGLRVGESEHMLTHLLVSYPGLAQRRLLCPMDRVADLGSRQVITRLGRPELGSLPTFRHARDIETDVWEALRSSDAVSDTDLSGVTLRVADGLVLMEGNVRTHAAVREIERLVRSIEGVADVGDRLIRDSDLDMAVAAYISREAPQLSGHIVVHAQLGAVLLEGYLPSRGDIDAIIQGIRAIPGVRRVEDLVTLRPPATVATGDVSAAATPLPEGGV